VVKAWQNGAISRETMLPLFGRSDYADSRIMPR
jgi:hypothetical protein